VFTQVISEAADLLPKGVMNVFTESTGGGSALLVESKDVLVIFLTGSTNTCRTMSAPVQRR